MKLGTNDIGSVYLGTSAVQKVYLGTNEVWSSFDADAQAFFDRVTTAGGSLSTTEQTAVNTLVLQMKNDGIWSKMKAIYPMVGASAAACSQNLKSSSFTGTFNGGWTFASTGAKPNGTNAYMDTSLVPSVVLSQNSTHLSYYSRTDSLTGNKIDIGTATGANGTSYRTYIIMYFSGNSYSNINSASDKVVSTMTDTRAFVLAYRNGASDFVNQVNSTKETITQLSGGLSDKSFYVSAFNRNGVADNFSLRECSFSSIGDGLTDTEASDLYTAVQAFNTTLSRQV